MSATEAAADLHEHGVAVVEALPEHVRVEWNDRLFAAMDEFPEYVATGRSVQRVLGGFGALGNASSFHHEAVRAWRLFLKHSVVAPICREYARRAADVPEDVHLEALYDRLCVRCEDFNRPSAETWHRDVYDAAKYRLRPLRDGDVVVGGWTNLDHRPQSFVGLPGTHAEDFHGGGGFAAFSAADIARHGFAARLAAQASTRVGYTLACNAAGEIVVPPGHAILFTQRLVHAVKGGAQPETPALRVFHGFRVTTSAEPLFDHEETIAAGAVPRIPSGQIPPMYSQNHYAAFSNKGNAKWREWACATFRPECLFRRTTSWGAEYHTPGSRGDVDRAANQGRYMPSLAQMGLHDAGRFGYTREDVDVLRPQRLF